MNKKIYKAIFVLLLIFFCTVYIIENCIVYYCNYGDRLDSDGITCVHIQYSEPIKEYSCYVSEYNEHLEGTKCVWDLYTPAGIDYHCPSGYTGYSTCSRMVRDFYTGYLHTEYVSAYKTYYCTSGTLIGTQCVNHYEYNAIVDYSCEIGYELDFYNNCINESRYDAYKKIDI